ncbi:O-antigen ligase family protein [Iningainema tapete]|uniref:O-antigen ligase family protein n=1 Tax=Iningainema tapete BLCC-T55 TaxID=2748662 RepID=A0A8J6Y2M3_9CYAN|nr:O-antigen ligase family protein [Iningainema tapete]MBD2778378.1 O-antigen ligase family protein [Iningainema tapete BLCC-T55]
MNISNYSNYTNARVNKFIRVFEQALVILSLSFFTGIFGIGAIGDLLPPAVVSLVRYIVWIISTILICVHWKGSLIVVSRNILLCVLTALAWLSFIWSEFPDFTWFNGKEICMMTTFGLYFATRFSLKEQVQLIAITLFIGASLSVIFAIGLPVIGIHGADHPGAWKGVYGYKNVLGSMMVLSSLAFFSLPKGNFALYKWGGFSLAIFLMLLSTSKTALVLSLLLLLIMNFYKNFRWQGKISVIFVDIGIIIFGCVALLMFSSWVELLTGLGRDPTLTGRTPLWSYAIARLMERPILGYGRGAFWAPGSGYAIEAGNIASPGWIPPHAHNGFIDLALDNGLIGLALFIIIYLTCLARSLQLAYATKEPEQIWPLAYLIFLAMNNMTESFLMRLGNIYWVLLITIVFTLKQKNILITYNNEVKL